MRKKGDNLVYVSNAGKPSRFLVDLASGGINDVCRGNINCSKSADQGVFLYKKFERTSVPKVDLLDSTHYDERSLAERLLIWQIYGLLGKPAIKLTVFALKRSGAIFQSAFNALELRLQKRKASSAKTENTALEPENLGLSAEEEDIRIPPFEEEIVLVRSFRGSLRPTIVFFCLLAVLAAPFKGFAVYQDVMDLKGSVMGALESALGSFSSGQEAIKDGDFTGATADFSIAARKIEDIKAQTDSIRALSVAFSALPLEDAKMAAAAADMLAVAEASARLGQELSGFLDRLDAEKKDISEIFALVNEELKTINATMATIIDGIGAIDPGSLPAAYRQPAQDIRDMSARLGRAFGEVSMLSDLLNYLFGYERDRRFLLVFQNNTELRASGGFIGSYAIIDLAQGKIKKLDVPGGGSYDTTAGMRDFIKAPEPLSLVNPRWYFWDANWWPDWTKSADKLEWFLEHSDGPTVDGVIALTPTVIERFLAVTGPVALDEYGLVIDSENFWPEIQILVEEKPVPLTAASGTAASAPPAIRHEPKKVIGDLMTAIIEELPKRLDRKMAIALADTLFRSLDEEQILLHFNDEKAQATSAGFGWEGAQSKTPADYLMVVNSNIAGGKTDKVVGERLKLITEIAPDGALINHLTIKRPHSGEPHTPLTGVRNVDWLRVYVPLGSELVGASGFNAPASPWFDRASSTWQDDPDVSASEGLAGISEDGTKSYNENGKTVFANWSMVDPGMTAIIELVYRLPFKFSAGHSLLAEKQPGSLGSELVHEMTLPDGKLWTVKDILTTDKYWEIK